MKAQRLIVIGMVLGLLLPAVSAQAGGGTCERRQSKVTLGYIACRLAAIESAVNIETAPDFSACEEQFNRRWEKLARRTECAPWDVAEALKGVSDKVSADLAEVVMKDKLVRCGNGVLEPGEECDSDDLGAMTCSTLGLGSGALSCTVECVLDITDCASEGAKTMALEPPPPTKRAFVTSLSYLGDLGGVPGADAHCNALAASARLGGAWVAWVSTPEVNAWERIADAEYRRLDGALIAANLDDLTDGTLANAISINERGIKVSKYVWTGTGPDGYYAGRDNCSDWTNGRATGTAKAGHTNSANEAWTSKAETVCDYEYPNPGLYCFEI